MYLQFNCRLFGKTKKPPRVEWLLLLNTGGLAAKVVEVDTFEVHTEVV